MIHFAPRSSVYLFLALAEESFLQLNSSSSAPCGKEDLRDAVPGERRYQTQGRKCLARVSPYTFSVSLTSLSLPSLFILLCHCSLTGSRERSGERQIGILQTS